MFKHTLQSGHSSASSNDFRVLHKGYNNKVKNIGSPTYQKTPIFVKHT